MLYSNYITYQLFDENELSRLNLLLNKLEEDDWVDDDVDVVVIKIRRKGILLSFVCPQRSDQNMPTLQC